MSGAAERSGTFRGQRRFGVVVVRSGQNVRAGRVTHVRRGGGNERDVDVDVVRSGKNAFGGRLYKLIRCAIH